MPFKLRADGSRGSYYFPDYIPVELPDSLKGESAVYINNMKTIDFSNAYETSIIVFQRIYINSKDAADKYSKKDIFILDGKLPMLLARTLKKDGRIIPLEGEQILESSSIKKNKYGKNVTKRIQLIYPDLTVGDVIDIAYQVKFDSYIYYDLITLEGDIPSLLSKISIRNMSMFDLTAFELNNMPGMKLQNIEGIKTLSWEKTGVKSRKSDYFNAFPANAPYAVYMLLPPNWDLNYHDYFEFDNTEFPIDQKTYFSITNYFSDIGAYDDTDDKYVKLKKLLYFLENSYEWLDNSKSSSVGETFKLMKEQKVNEVLYIRYVMKFLSEQDIKFEKGFTKSLLNGKFEHGLVSFEQLAQRFLVFYDYDSNPHFIFPPEEKKQFYYLDEIPYYMEGNQSILLFGTNDELKNTSPMLLPESGTNDNSHSGNILFTFEKGDSIKTVMKRRDVFKGQYSFLVRNQSGEAWLEELGISRDSLIMKPASVDYFYPYETKFELDSVEVNVFEAIDDSLYWLNVSDFLPIGVYQEDEAYADWSDYIILPFLKKNELSFFVKSESPIAIAEESKELSFKNDIGSIQAKVNQVNENIVKVEYKIHVSKRLITGKEDVKNLQDLMKNYQEIRNKKWIVRI